MSQYSVMLAILFLFQMTVSRTTTVPVAVCVQPLRTSITECTAFVT